MNIKATMDTIGKKASDVGDAILDGLGSIDANANFVGNKIGGKLYSTSADILFDEGIQGVGRKAALGVNRSAFKVGNAVGGGAEGLIAGAAGGAVIGGIAGGVDEDESFIGGMGKGLLAGAGVGLVGGAASGYAHSHAGLVSNIMDDSSAVAARIATLRGAAGESINNVKSKFGR